MKRIFAALSLSFIVIGLLIGCGGGDKNGPPNVQISITPFQVSMDAGQTQQFTATVTGSTNTAVTWSVSGTGCSGADCGTIDANGLYTAPALIANNATAKVSATSQANTGVTMSSTVTLNALVVTMHPKSYSLDAGMTETISATVTHHTNTALTWSMSGTGCSGTDCGTFDSNTGIYTAPALVLNQATVSITATSVADPTKFDTCTVTLVPISISISPTAVTLDAGQNMQFTATISHHTNTAVTWSLSGPGLLSNTGLYSAPAVNPNQTTATVIATSVADPSKSASATVTLLPLFISISPTTATLGGGQTQQFTATITHHANKTVTWSLSGLGSLSNTGLYTAPAVVTDQTTATVTATSVVDPARSASATVTLIPITVGVSPATASVVVGGTQQFTATVTGTSNTSVTWSVSGAGCSGDDCGTINSTGLYLAPSNEPNPPTVTVTATSAVDITKSGTATVTIVLNTNILLNGHYALRFAGFDAAGEKVMAVGSFTADGNGNITNGLLDYNTVAGSEALQMPFTATYTIGADRRGQVNTTLAPFPVLRLALDGTGEKGHLVQFDTTGQRGSGVIQKQTVADFHLSSGDFAFGMVGSSVGGERNVGMGRFHCNNAGAITNGKLDSKTAGETPMLNVDFSGTLAMDSTYGTNNGRGTMTISMAGGSALVHTSFYMVDADEVFLLSTDPVNLNAPLLSGTALRQSGLPFSNASWSGPSVYYLTAAEGVPLVPAVLVGYIEPDGVGNQYGEYARNWGGSVWEFGNWNVAYSIDQYGRGSFNSNTFGPYTFYLISQNTGFFLGIGSLEDVSFGKFEQQVVPSGGFKNATFSGDYFIGTAEMPTNNAITTEGSWTWDSIAAFAGVVDISSITGNNADQAVAGTYTVTGTPVKPNDGKGTVMYTQPTASKAIFYPVSSSRIFMISVDPGNNAATVTILEK
ncbi:MAG: hypothetical protein WCC22_05850 [Terriglobales bacterium]